MVIGILSLAFFAQGMAALGWTLVSDIAPKGLFGLTGGIFNFAANLAGIITPLVIGFIVAATGSFFGALTFIAVVALVGAFSYIFIRPSCACRRTADDSLSPCSRRSTPSSFRLSCISWG